MLEKLHLSYSEVTGFYTKEEGKIDESSIYMRMDPYNYMNDKNAIMLNCKDPEFYNHIYTKAIERFYKN